MQLTCSRSSWTGSLFVVLLFSLIAATGCGTGFNAITTSSTKALSSLSLSPSSATVAAGASEQLTATAKYSDGTSRDVSASVLWSAAKTAVATVNATGTVVATAAGVTAITASLSGVSATATLTVTAGPAMLMGVTVTPASASVVVGAEQAFVATGTYSDGSTQDVSATATWGTANAAVAVADAHGVVTGAGIGSTRITASLSGVSGSAMVTVASAPKTLTFLVVTPSSGFMAAGTTQQLVATGTYSDGTTASVNPGLSWSSSNGAVATVTTTGLVTGVAAGTATITATFAGASGSAVLTVRAKAVAMLTSSPSTGSLVVGATQQLMATAKYTDGATSNVSSTAVWATSNSATATVNGSGLVTAVAVGTATIKAIFQGATSTTVLTVTGRTVSSIAVTPHSGSVAMGGIQQCTATATYSDGSTADVTSKVTWVSSNPAVAKVRPDGLVTAVASGLTTITAEWNGESGTTPLSVTLIAGTGVNIPTWHMDANRSGLNAAEASLAPSNVRPSTFGKLFSYQVDGYVYAEPLLMSGLSVNGATHNVLYAATEQDSVYAFDADTYGSGAPLWMVSLLHGGETPMTNGPIQPFQGVTSTPVIDAATGTMYVVSVQTAQGSAPTFRLNALDITTGAQKFGGPVTLQASVPGSNVDAVHGSVSLTTACVQRAALLLANGNVYIGFGGCHSGWLLAYRASTLAQVGVFNASPDLNGEGPFASAGGVWMGGAGPAADGAGNVYITTGNGPWDGKSSFGDSVLKFSPTLQREDYFTPSGYAYLNCADKDLASGGVLLIPGTTEAVVGGKTGKLYLVNTQNLGREQPQDAGATQTVWVEGQLLNPYPDVCTDSAGAHTEMINSYENFGTAAYFNGAVYVGVSPTLPNVPARVAQFLYAGKLTPAQYSAQNVQENTLGTTPFLSANGSTNGILWMIDEGVPLQEPGTTNAVLRAYDAANLSDEIYDSSIHTADVPGYGIKFTSPIVGNGKVYLSTGHDQTTTAHPKGELDVYGLK